MTDFKHADKKVIAMIHVGALPGTPCHKQSISEIIALAVSEAKTYISCGVDALMIENMHDVPYEKNQASPEIISGMTAVAVELRKLTSLPIGIQILAAANREALAVALAANLNFIRAEGFVFGHLADEGYIDSNAARLMRYRKQIGAEHIKIFTDIKKKHSSHAISADVSLAETIHAAAFFLSDGIIVTGAATGCETDLDHLHQAGNATKLPLFVGSGITAINLINYWNHADGFIVGSNFKYDGDWKNNVDPVRVTKFMNEVQMLRENNKLRPK